MCSAAFTNSGMYSPVPYAMAPCCEMALLRLPSTFFFFISSSFWALLISSSMLQEWNLCPEPYKGHVLFFVIGELIDQLMSNCLNRIDVCGVPLAGRGVWAELVFAHITIACYFRVFIVVMTGPLWTESNQNVVMMIKIKDPKWWTGGKIFCICGSRKEAKTCMQASLTGLQSLIFK